MRKSIPPTSSPKTLLNERFFIFCRKMNPMKKLSRHNKNPVSTEVKSIEESVLDNIRKANIIKIRKLIISDELMIFRGVILV